MNLKESFRYQNFLSELMRQACESITMLDHCTTETRFHNRSAKNPDATDIAEEVEREPFVKNDTVIQFMKFLINERKCLTLAINKAKRECEFDIDAAVEMNKFRQRMSSSIKTMLTRTAAKTVVKGSDYKFNSDGNQMPYYYDITVRYEEAYDREKSKEIALQALEESDALSSQIDLAMVKAVLDFEPAFNVNQSYEDIIESFAKTVNQ